MTSIIKYRKVIADGTTYQLVEPDYADGADRCVEIATVAGATYVAVPATATLPPQPKQITVTPVTLTPDLNANLKAASPHVRLINSRVVERIRERYSADDEIKLVWMKTGPDVDAYRAYVSECVAIGSAAKAVLGLQ